MEQGKGGDDNNSFVKKDIRERAFDFAVRIVKLCQFLEENTNVHRRVIGQIVGAGTSIGANLEEAQAGQSRADFISKNLIALKEARETNFWLRLLLASYEFQQNVSDGIAELNSESTEIANIIGAIVVKTKNTQRR